MAAARSTAREFGYDINPAARRPRRANCSTTRRTPTSPASAATSAAARTSNGVDLNGDGDTLDQVTVLAPSQTRTRRYAVVAGLAYEINKDHIVRVTLHARLLEPSSDGPSWLREGEWRAGRRLPGQRSDCRGVGVDLQKRDRQSYAILDKVAAQYRGQFGPLRLVIGASMPYFKRDLENFCFTSSASGFVECSGQDGALDDVIEANNPYTFNPTTGAITGFSPPGKRVLKYHKFLPDLGVVYASRTPSRPSRATPRTSRSRAPTTFTTPITSRSVQLTRSHGRKRRTRSTQAFATAPLRSRLRSRDGLPSSTIAWPRPTIRNSTRRSTGTSVAWISGASTARWPTSRSAS